MPVVVAWDNQEQRIITLTFEIGWKLEEFYHAMSRANAMIRNTPHHVFGYIVHSPREVMPPASAINAFKQALAANDMPMAFVEPNHAVRVMIDTVRKVYRIQRPVRYVRTQNEARQFIHQHYQQSQSS